MNPVDEPFSLNKTGVNTSTVQLVSIEFEDSETGNWNPVTPSNLQEGDEDNLNYYYNESSNASQLEYYYGSYWLAELEPNMTRGDPIKYNASGTVDDDGNSVPSNGVVNVTEDLQVGDYNMTVLTDIPFEANAGEEFSLEVQVTNSSSLEYLNNSDIDVWAYFANDSWSSTQYDLGNYDSSGDFFYNDRVNYPSEPGSDYVIHVEANTSGGNRSHGTYSRTLSTAPAIEGFIDDFNASSGCSNETDVAKCEAGANISYSYSITNSEANTVNLSVYGFNSSGRHELGNDSLAESSSGYYTGEIQVPDLNTSRYEEEMEFVFNASNQDRSHVDRRNVTYESFSMDDRSEPSTFIGSEHQIELLFSKPYSGTPYDKERFQEINANVTDSQGSEVENLSIEDFSYDSSTGLITSSILIESDAPTGTYDLDVGAMNIYEEERTSSFSFNVQDVDATFDVENQATFSVNRLEERRYFVDIENLIESTNQIDFDEILPENTEFVNNSIELDASEQEVMAFDVNLTSLEDDSGDILFMDNDTSYNETLEISINAAECQIQEGDICSETEEVSATATGTDEIDDSIDIRNVGPSGENVEFNVSVEGDVSQFLSIDGETENLTLEDNMQIDLTFSPDVGGEYDGDVVFMTEAGTDLEVPASLTFNTEGSSGGGSGSGPNDSSQDGVDASEVTITPTSISLGSVIPGETPSETIQVRNNGEESISPVEVTSSDYVIGSTAVNNVPAGATRDIIITFDNMGSSGNGGLQVEAGPATETVSVSATLETSSSGEDESGSEEDEGQSNEDPQSTQPEQDEGGFPVVPVAGGVIVFLLIAFVFFTSYVPDEGDPLYDVLGEGQ
jgi:hypothetical protein